MLKSSRSRRININVCCYHLERRIYILLNVIIQVGGASKYTQAPPTQRSANGFINSSELGVIECSP